MTNLSDRIDHFVRWFVNSSPHVTHFEPRAEPAKRRGACDEKAPHPGRDVLGQVARRVPTHRGVKKFDRVDSLQGHAANVARRSSRRWDARAAA